MAGSSHQFVPLDSPEGVARQAEELTRRLLDRREYPRPPGAYSEWWLALLAGYVAADEQWADQVVLDVITRLHAAVMAEAGPLLRAAPDR